MFIVDISAFTSDSRWYSRQVFSRLIHHHLAQNYFLFLKICIFSSNWRMCLENCFTSWWSRSRFWMWFKIWNGCWYFIEYLFSYFNLKILNFNFNKLKARLKITRSRIATVMAADKLVLLMLKKLKMQFLKNKKLKRSWVQLRISWSMSKRRLMSWNKRFRMRYLRK